MYPRPKLVFSFLLHPKNFIERDCTKDMENSPNHSCLSGSQPIPLSSSNLCQDGFYCPSNNNTLKQHLPIYCPPSPDCLLIRLQSSDNLCAVPQGNLEPVVCMPGFYCPSGGQQQIECPWGHFCPLGTVTPFECTVMSICSPGSSHQIPLLGLFLCLLLDMMMILGACIVPRYSPAAKGLAGFFRLTRPRSYPQSDENDSTENIPLTQQFQDFFSRDNIHSYGLSLNFTDICLRPRRAKREILCGLRGNIHSGSVLGIMGPSGSGKSSFVNILSGRVQSTQGCVLINGRRVEPAELRDLVGFVPQHDAVLPDITVRENILYSGRVLLGGQLPDQKIQEYTDFLISSLGITYIRDQLVGDLLKKRGRGISGGEFKRVSIAIALAAAPRILVLDEPTSGLDSTGAHSVMKLLHSISRQGIMVVCVIHQPRVEIFRLLDDVMTLNAGTQVYLGKAADAQLFFEQLGHKFPVTSNPADVILDVLLNHSHAPHWKESQPSGFGTADPAALIEVMKKRRAPWSRQLWLALCRSTIQQSRQTTGLALEIVSSAVIGLMIGLSAFESRGQFFQGIYHHPFDLLSSSVEYRLIAEQGLLCCLAIACAAGPPGVKIFGEEKLTFYRESQCGHSRSAYFLGKNLAVCFRMLMSSLHFTAFYLVLAAPMIPFNSQLVLGFLYSYCIYGLGFIVSAVTRREDGPMLCMLLCLIVSALSGCAPRLSTVREWHLEWFWYSWPATWFSEAFYQENTAPVAYLYNIPAAFTFTGYKIGRTGMDMGFLALIGTLYRALSYLLFAFWGWNSE